MRSRPRRVLGEVKVKRANESRLIARRKKRSMIKLTRNDQDEASPKNGEQQCENGFFLLSTILNLEKKYEGCEVVGGRQQNIPHTRATMTIKVKTYYRIPWRDSTTEVCTPCSVDHRRRPGASSGAIRRWRNSDWPWSRRPGTWRPRRRRTAGTSTGPCRWRSNSEPSWCGIASGSWDDNHKRRTAGPKTQIRNNTI